MAKRLPGGHRIAGQMISAPIGLRRPPSVSPRSTGRRRFVLASAAAAACVGSAARTPHALASDAPAVAAASDLQFVLPAIADRFRVETGRALRLSFGSSGNFAHQIEQGAPFELFLSADEQYVFRLADRGVVPDRGMLYAIGRIALFVPRGSTLKADPQLRDLKAALADGRVRRFAIANPEHAPYGRAARAALRHADAWSAIEPRLVIGENAAQAAQFAASGSAQGGIVPWSLAHSTPMAALGEFAPIDPAWHRQEPLRQRAVLARGAGETARAFLSYLERAQAREIFRRHGFALPGDGDR